MDERVTRQKQNKNTRVRGNKMATEGKDIQELAKRRRSRSRQTEVTAADFSSNNSVNGKRDKRTNFVCEQEENSRENKVKRRNDQSRRYGKLAILNVINNVFHIDANVLYNHSRLLLRFGTAS